MRNLRLPIAACVACFGVALFASAPAYAVPTLVYGSSGVCPETNDHTPTNGGGTGSATDCNEFITVAANGTASTTNGPQAIFEGEDDALFGVTNNSSQTISGLQISSALYTVFDFDDDGIDVYTFSNASQAVCGAANFNTTAGLCQQNISPLAGNPDDTSYGGLDAYYTSISTDFMSGTVNFLGGIAPGQTAFFSLEDPDGVALDNLSITPITPSTPPTGVPEPGTLALLGAGLAALGARRKMRKV